MERYTFEPIGRIHSCYTEKFGIPRQSGLVPDAPSILEIFSPFDRDEAFRELEGFSHVWLLFVFHRCLDRPWKATVRPPRLGGNTRVGVFASRSGFRPNPLGQSVVRLESLERGQGVLRLHLKGADLLDGTPVLDIKPYLPYADSIADAVAGYAPAAPRQEPPVVYSPEAEMACRLLEASGYPNLEQLITAHLRQDPRPAYRKGEERNGYGMRLWDVNIRFRFEDGTIRVDAIIPPTAGT
jgi:tRNA (adenine37-N6)-methyltransferase